MDVMVPVSESESVMTSPVAGATSIAPGNSGGDFYAAVRVVQRGLLQVQKGHDKSAFLPLDRC